MRIHSVTCGLTLIMSGWLLHTCFYGNHSIKPALFDKVCYPQGIADLPDQEDNNGNIANNKTRENVNLNSAEEQQALCVSRIGIFLERNSSSDLVNPFPFKPLLHPAAPCADTDLYLLVYVHSSPLNYRRRQVIRQTWGNSSQYTPLDVKISVMFVMGIQKNTTEPDESVINEASMYHDILIDEYVDTYRNLTYKAMSALRYITVCCQHVPLVLKTDDDIVIDMFQL